MRVILKVLLFGKMESWQAWLSVVIVVVKVNKNQNLGASKIKAGLHGL